MDILILEKALNTVKTLVTLAVGLNVVVLLLGVANLIQKGKFNGNLN